MNVGADVKQIIVWDNKTQGVDGCEFEVKCVFELTLSDELQKYQANRNECSRKCFENLIFNFSLDLPNYLP
jgi:hypothetical protein